MSQATKISKALSWLLRHGATQEGLDIDSAGWVKVTEVLDKPRFSRVSVDKIREIVENCPKQRFRLEEKDGELFIRANQGHSLQVEDLELEEIASGDGITAIHGTYKRNWESIKKNGLSRMNRNHVHFTSKTPEEGTVISGMRKTCEVYIFVDVERALQGGLRFYKSANDVILCPGNDEGTIPTEYFLKVVDKKSGELLLC